MAHHTYGGPIRRLMKSRTIELVVTHFAPLLFAGLMLTGLIEDHWNFAAHYATSPATVYAIILGIGFLVSAGTFWLCRRFGLRSASDALLLSGLGFLCGVLPAGMVLSIWILLAVTLFTVLVVILRVSSFLQKVTALLKPNNYPHWSQVGMLLYIYLSLLTAFTLFNLGLDLFHTLNIDDAPAFNFSEAGGSALANSFYFSVVIMTTLGFGDITPLTSTAKVAVALQCLTSYVMFALLVGVITRGVLGKDDPQDE